MIRRIERIRRRSGRQQAAVPREKVLEAQVGHEVPRRRRQPAVELLPVASRSEEHTSELQSLRHLVCRLLLEKKKEATDTTTTESATKRIERIHSAYVLVADTPRRPA